MSTIVTCEEAWAAARAYVAKHAAQWKEGRITAVCGKEDVCACQAAIDAAMLADDVEATKAACRTWWAAFLAHAR